MDGAVLKFGLATVAYKEERFIKPFLKHIPDWVEEKIVLNSTMPWFGKPEQHDKTGEIAEPYARVIQTHWPTEHAQRNTGQALLSDCDWVITMDPDEFLTKKGWDNLKAHLEKETEYSALSSEVNQTYWKDGWVAYPPEGHRSLIAVKPNVTFVEKRVVPVLYSHIPGVELHHFSWARTDKEVRSKLSHYSERHFDWEKWYNEVWLNWNPGDKDVHPSTPESLHDFKKAELPEEIEALNLWPK